MQRIYLDYNATSPLRSCVVERFHALATRYGNPSSMHMDGQSARHRVERARHRLSEFLHCDPQALVFTSGATEANVTLTSGHLRSREGWRPKRLLLSAVEHPSILKGHRFSPECVSMIPVTPEGILDLNAFEQACEQFSHEALLVCIQSANQELGTLQPIDSVVALAKRHGQALVISDCVQSIVHNVLDFKRSGLDAVTFSGHKLGALTGIGGFVLSERVLLDPPFIGGGGQEHGLRGGTEHTLGIESLAGVVDSVEVELSSRRAWYLTMRSKLCTELKAMHSGVLIFSEHVDTLPQTLAFAFPEMDSEALVIRMDLLGFSISTGTACSSALHEPSYVLRALGTVPETVRNAVRISYGWNTTEDDLSACIDGLRCTLSGLQRTDHRYAIG